MSGWTIELNELLDEYVEGVAEIVEETAKEVALKTAKTLKATSPKGNRGRYAKGWSVKSQGGGYVVHNKTDYQLTHLLENGHVIKNQYGSYGRVNGTKHIEPAEKDANEEFQDLVRERIERGGS